MPLRRAQVPRHDAGAAGEREGQGREVGQEGQNVGEESEEEMTCGLSEPITL